MVEQGSSGEQLSIPLAVAIMHLALAHQAVTHPPRTFPLFESSQRALHYGDFIALVDSSPGTRQFAHYPGKARELVAEGPSLSIPLQVLGQMDLFTLGVAGPPSNTDITNHWFSPSLAWPIKGI